MEISRVVYGVGLGGSKLILYSCMKNGLQPGNAQDAKKALLEMC